MFDEDDLPAKQTIDLPHLVRENHRLFAENARLEAKLTSGKAHKADLETTKTKLTKEFKDLQAQVAKLEDERAALKAMGATGIPNEWLTCKMTPPRRPPSEPWTANAGKARTEASFERIYEAFRDQGMSQDQAVRAAHAKVRGEQVNG